MTRKGGRIRRACHELPANEIAGKPKSLNVRSSMRRPAFRKAKSHAIRSAFCLQSDSNRCPKNALGPHWGHISGDLQFDILSQYINDLIRCRQPAP